MQPLLQVKSFADEWHQGKWRARDLPEAIGADVLWAPGGQAILGYAYSLDSLRAVVFNSRIRGTPLEWPVIYHEAAHIVRGDLMGLCGNAWAERQSERNATYGSALLAIPTESAVLLTTRRASVVELVDYYEVPRPMVTMRGALAVLLGEAEGNRERARQQLAYSRRSLESWMTRLAREI